jgi:hypothetical protein
MKIALKVRNLQTSEDGTVDFESVERAADWLRIRPPFIEVLGLATDGVSPEISNSLKAAMRPLSPEEKVLEQKLTAAHQAVLEKMAKERMEREKKELASMQAAHQNADPNRPMELSWTYDHGLVKGDPNDPRDITDEARAAVMAWVEERLEWVRDRNQIVGSAKLTVYPAKLPKPEADRVERGTFVPCAAPAEKRDMN